MRVRNKATIFMGNTRTIFEAIYRCVLSVFRDIRRYNAGKMLTISYPLCINKQKFPGAIRDRSGIKTLGGVTNDTY